MTPEERAQSVLHFLHEYLVARDVLYTEREPDFAQRLAQFEYAKSFLGTALVALVTEAKGKTDA